MNYKALNLSKNPYTITYIVYAITFLFLVFKGPIFSPDSYSYLNTEISRFPGYVICMRVFKYILGPDFGHLLVAFHMLFGFSTIHFTLKGFQNLLKLNFWSVLFIFGVLISPYFQSIYVANNITSEGLSYPFYLVFITASALLIFNNNKKMLLWSSFAFILLTLTRGQFIICSVIVAFIYGIKHYVGKTLKPNFIVIIVLVCLPFLSKTLDSLYRKILFDHYVSTPYSYVNAVALPLFISHEDNINLIESQESKDIFEFSYKRIDSLDLLSSKDKGDHYYRYKRFHNNFPPICNQNIHSGGIKYFYNKGFSAYESYIKTEQVCKSLMLPLIKANFKEYITLYFTSIMYGFKSIPLAIAILALAFWSFIKCLKKFNLLYGIILLTTLLALSNAMIVAVACHSIDRYLFYNNFLIAITALLLLNKIIKPTK